jgi:phosphoribosylformimino-5-aminoimidazole carboxamide ribotide isomerase
MIDIIPALDIIDGKCVRLTQGDFNKVKVYDTNPLDVALRFVEMGIKRLHMVDLDGAKQGQICNLPVLEAIAKNTSLVIDYGGGIKTSADVESIFNAGASMVSVGSMAFKDPMTFFNWIQYFGNDKVLLGADSKNEELMINGWQTSAEILIYDFIGQNIAAGVTQIFCTDVASDGAMKGPSFNLYYKILQRYPELHLIASGGVSRFKDITELEKIGCKGVIVGKSLYENKISLEEINKYTNVG